MAYWQGSFYSVEVVECVVCGLCMSHVTNQVVVFLSVPRWDTYKPSNVLS